MIFMFLLCGYRSHAHCACVDMSLLVNTLKVPAFLSDPNERAHFWLPGSEAKTAHELLDSPTDDRMYIDAGEIVRVRVEADEFYDDEPGPPKATEGVQQMHLENRRAPYTITVCLLVETSSTSTDIFPSAQSPSKV